MKYLLWALVLYLAWRWFSASRAIKRDATAPAPTSEAADAQGVERMVKCAECGLHLPVSEALPGAGDRYFCSEAHREGRRAS